MPIILVRLQGHILHLCCPHRYELYWLPLAARYQATKLAAPLDIAWAWHVHMLAPDQYEVDCKRVCSAVVGHTLLVGDKRKKALEKAREAWATSYPGEPFEV